MSMQVYRREFGTGYLHSVVRCWLAVCAPIVTIGRCLLGVQVAHGHHIGSMLVLRHSEMCSTVCQLYTKIEQCKEYSKALQANGGRRLTGCSEKERKQKEHRACISNVTTWKVRITTQRSGLAFSVCQMRAWPSLLRKKLRWTVSRAGKAEWTNTGQSICGACCSRITVAVN